MMNLMEQLPFLQDFPPIVQSIIINLILFVVAIVMILVLRRVFTLMIVRPLRSLAGRTSSSVDNMIVDEILAPLRVAVVGFALIFTVNIINFGSEIQQIAEVLSRTLMIGAVFYALLKVYAIVSLRPILFKQITGLTIPERLLPFLNTVIKSLIVILGTIFVLQELNFDVAALIASLGVVGIGISLASQDTVSNLFGFAAIVTDNPFKVGDFINTPDVTGVVEKVGMRSTRIRQLDQAFVTVPNNLLTNAVVLNWSRLEKRRLNFTIGLTYDTTSQQIRTLIQHLRELLKNTEDVDPESVIVHFVEFGASSLDIIVISQVLLPAWGDFTARKEDIYLEIMEIVEKLGLSFAFPSQSVYIENMPGVMTPQATMTAEQREMMRIMQDDEESHQEDGTGDVGDQVGESVDQG
jgi:MscS family membrane protein